MTGGQVIVETQRLLPVRVAGAVGLGRAPIGVTLVKPGPLLRCDPPVGDVPDERMREPEAPLTRPVLLQQLAGKPFQRLQDPGLWSSSSRTRTSSRENCLPTSAARSITMRSAPLGCRGGSRAPRRSLASREPCRGRRRPTARPPAAGSPSHAASSQTALPAGGSSRSGHGSA